MKASTLMHFNHIAAFPMRLWVDHNASTASLADSSIDEGVRSWTTCSQTPAGHITALANQITYSIPIPLWVDHKTSNALLADSQQKGGAKLLDDLLRNFLSGD